MVRQKIKIQSFVYKNYQALTSNVSQLGFYNRRNLTQPLRKWHCSKLNKRLQKFYLPERRHGRSFYNKIAYCHSYIVQSEFSCLTISGFSVQISSGGQNVSTGSYIFSQLSSRVRLA